MALRRCLALLILLPLLLTFGFPPQATPAATTDAEDAAVEAVQRLGGKVVHADNDPAKPIVKADLSRTQVAAAGLKNLADLKGLQTLNLWDTKVTDAGLKELAGLKGLQTLNLADTKVTDAGLKELAGLKGLQTLDLSYTKVTDAGLKELAGLK